MYCDQTTVTFLARNCRSGLTSGDITSMAALVEPDIDSRLAQLWFWPFGSDGTDLRTGAIPPAISSISNLLVAAALEAAKVSFSQGVAASADGGETMQIPYGTTLQRMGQQRLKGIAEGTNSIPELERRTPCRVNRTARPAQTQMRRIW